MKVYILPVDDKLQPSSQPFNYPEGNPDFGIEQDFLEYLTNDSCVTDSAEEADWHYLPVFWTRWHLNHNYGKEGLGELRAAVSNAIINSKRTFTVCQYDDGPSINLKLTKIFLGSRKGNNGTDAPLLRSMIKLPILRPRKRFVASFIGRLSTHQTRQKMADALKDFKDVLISDGDKGQKFFIENTLRSYASLCPRGYGGGSFRFFEAMQMGVVPILIGDKDTRPFKKFIDWDSVSFYVDSTDKLVKLLRGTSKTQYNRMGVAARKLYMKELQYGKWCKYVMRELEAAK